MVPQNRTTTLQNKDGKFKSVWRALGLPEDAPKSKVNKAFREVVANHEVEAAEAAEQANRPQNQIRVFEYLTIWLERSAKGLQINTYRSYHEEELLTLLKLTKDDPIYPAIMLAGGLGLKVCFAPYGHFMA